MTRPVLPAAVRDALIAHARRDAPRECCGFLIGRRGRVQFAMPLQNIDAEPESRYRIDDHEHIEVRRRLRQLVPPLEILGVYHSHPNGPARPSPTDCAEANYPDWVFAIVDVSGRQAQVKLFKIAKGRASVM